ncbi:MAG: aspartate carbamoyltransferase regulatory subunit [Candidatus Altiarchaeales archaeon ex4484_96]|nr:MAG: aspartate carbamoyltransferase regulatory subunit [Candidatus Altiarchaeales archaeon ex4484_96]
MEDKSEGRLKIRNIKNGISIDHITAGKAPEVLRILGIDMGFTDSVTIAMNVKSSKMRKKDILKVENRDLDVNEINKISVIAPQATINWIQDYHVVRKEKVKLPKELKDIVECPNPSCITNKEREPVKSIFIVKNTNPVELVCRYCERETSIESLY